MVLIEALLLILTLLVTVYWYINRTFTYWKRKGVQYIEPSKLYGNSKGVYTTLHVSEILKEPYRQMKDHGPLGGIYLYNTPIALLFDLKLIKTVLVKDFQNFMDRGLYYNKKDDPISGHLFALNATEWKQMRNKMTPTFTSGKMKYMYTTVEKVGNELQDALDAQLKISNIVEVKEIAARYTIDVVGTCGFGIECNSLRDPAATFSKMSREVFERPVGRILRIMISNVSSKLAQLLRLKVWPVEVSNFFLKTVSDTVNYREQNHIKRNDFMDLMIQLKRDVKDSESSDGLTVVDITAQVFVFFVAGFDTSSSLMAFTLYELAQNPDIQSKARREIKEVLQKYNGLFTYEAMMDMKYIEQILNESLRIYPPVTTLNRRTIKKYPVPGTNITLDPNTLVWIPVKAIHHDPEYYPDPLRFDPDRFTPEAVAARDPMTFLPFGDGPRNCIALRFGRMQSRVGLVKILQKFSVSICSKTSENMVIDPKPNIQSPIGGVWLKFRKLENDL